MRGIHLRSTSLGSRAVLFLYGGSEKIWLSTVLTKHRLKRMMKTTTLSSRFHPPNLLGSLGPVHYPPQPSTSPRLLPTAPPVLLNILQVNPLRCFRPPASTRPPPNPLHTLHCCNHRLWHLTRSTTPFARISSCHKVSRNVYPSRYRHQSANGSRSCRSSGYVISRAGLLRLPGTTPL